jgi:hypothetical protein
MSGPDRGAFGAVDADAVSAEAAPELVLIQSNRCSIANSQNRQYDQVRTLARGNGNN